MRPKVGDKLKLLSTDGAGCLSIEDEGKLFTIVEVERGWGDDDDYYVEGHGKRFFGFNRRFAVVTNIIYI